MICMNDFIRANTWKMEKYFQAIVSQSPTPPKLTDPNACTGQDILYFHNILTHNTTKILQLVEEDDRLYSQLSDLLEGLRQYRHIDKFLEKKYTSDQPATIRLSIETEEQTYEQTLDGTVLFLQPLILKLIVFLFLFLSQTEIRKHETKKQKNAPKVAREAKKEVKRDPTVFGKPLDELMDYQQSFKPDLKIPEFLGDALSYILMKGSTSSSLTLKRFSTRRNLSSLRRKERDGRSQKGN